MLNGWWTPGPAEQVRVAGAVPPCPAAGTQTTPREVAQGERAIARTILKAQRGAGLQFIIPNF
jgi:hypothetical protein